MKLTKFSRKLALTLSILLFPGTTQPIIGEAAAALIGLATAIFGIRWYEKGATKPADKSVNLNDEHRRQVEQDRQHREEVSKQLHSMPDKSSSATQTEEQNIILTDPVKKLIEDLVTHKLQEAQQSAANNTDKKHTMEQQVNSNTQELATLRQQFKQQSDTASQLQTKFNEDSQKQINELESKIKLLENLKTALSKQDIEKLKKDLEELQNNLKKTNTKLEATGALKLVKQLTTALAATFGLSKRVQNLEANSDSTAIESVEVVQEDMDELSKKMQSRFAKTDERLAALEKDKKATSEKSNADENNKTVQQLADRISNLEKSNQTNITESLVSRFSDFDERYKKLESTMLTLTDGYNKLVKITSQIDDNTAVDNENICRLQGSITELSNKKPKTLQQSMAFVIAELNQVKEQHTNTSNEAAKKHEITIAAQKSLETKLNEIEKDTKKDQENNAESINNFISKVQNNLKKF